jgi:hypothetical protein
VLVVVTMMLLLLVAFAVDRVDVSGGVVVDADNDAHVAAGDFTINVILEVSIPT